MAIADDSIGAVLDDVASDRVAPSGGAIAALTGASGTALCEMGCHHTIGKDGDEDVDAALADVASDLRSHRGDLLELADADADAVDALQSAYRRAPSDERSEAIERASRRAVEAPLSIAETCLDVLEQAEVVAVEANDRVLPDVGTGALFVHAALRTAGWIVRLNTAGADESAVPAGAESRVDDLSTDATRTYASIEDHLETALGSTP